MSKTHFRTRLLAISVFFGLSLGALFLPVRPLSGLALGDEASPSGTCAPPQAHPGRKTPADTLAMAARIDELLAQRWSQASITPSPLSSDSEFLRRAYLDLTGTIPSVTAVREFLANTDPGRRAKLIDELLTRPTHASHLATIWRKILLPDDTEGQAGATNFESWLRIQFAANVPYNRVAAELLTTSGTTGQINPVFYYSALKMKPEDLAASTSRVLLGVQIQCAQCHDHPMDRWKQKDFWSYAAFFARLQQPAEGDNGRMSAEVVEASLGELKLPQTEEIAYPRFLGDTQQAPEPKLTRRTQLASWVTSNDNRYFSQAAVNRVWFLMFGRGIVQPVDDFSDRNPPSHPEILNELSAYFTESGFDLRELFRVIANTKAYQLTSQSADADPSPELFSRMAIKSLTAEQLFDCLSEAMRRRGTVQKDENPQFNPLGGDSARQAFISKFRAPTAGLTEYQAGIPQALTLMNGTLVGDATTIAKSDLLTALSAPFLADPERIEILFLSTVSRPPSDDEKSSLSDYLSQAGDKSAHDQALGDILWALLNSAEFVFNH